VTTAEEALTSGATRRNFFVGAIYAMWALVAAALGVPAFVYLFFPPKARRESKWFTLGDVSKLSPDAPVAMVFRRNRVDGWKVLSEESSAWVVRRAGSAVIAFGPQCTHLGCAYHWDESKSEFVCPCHNSTFSIDGKVLAGPAPRPLDRYTTRIEGSKILIDGLHQVSVETP
jgi:quinol---cytochrome c reductase iron-sulfur subunit, bacillus type